MNGNDREIQSWIANTPEASFISMAVHGQSLYRLNYPFRYGRWHFQCTSWNGKTGEWQLWIRGERIGRGFHNRVSSLYDNRASGRRSANVCCIMIESARQ